MMTSLPSDFEIAPGYEASRWSALSLDASRPQSASWQLALQIFEGRIRTRFLEPVDALIELEGRHKPKKFGFTILAIDCLLIETLQAFREGECLHRSKSRHLFTSFLKRWSAFQQRLPAAGTADDWAKRIYEGYRCELHHAGATAAAFRVRASGPAFTFKSERDICINRTLLHVCLKEEFQNYLRELKRPEMSELRRNFKKKMNCICGLADA